MCDERPHYSFCQDSRHKPNVTGRGAWVLFPTSLHCLSGTEGKGAWPRGCTVWDGESTMQGVWVCIQAPFHVSSCLWSGGYLHTATGTPPPRLRPRLGGPCSPPTPAMRFSGAWWRAERPWRPSRSWRTGETSQVWGGAWVGFPGPQGLARGQWFQKRLPSLES